MSSSEYKRYIENFDINLLKCKLLGRGHNGIVYLLPDGKVMKICFDEKSCVNEYYILNKVNGNKYFPRVYGICGNYMIRDYVGGETLKDYIKKNGLSREMAKKVINLLEEFDKLKFTKQDVRCKDIFVQRDGSLKIIDPKQFYSKDRSFPRHLSKGLNRLNVLDFFMEVVQQERPGLYKKWSEEIANYRKNL